MKLYTTLTSPYGRIARVVIIEKRLESRVAIVAAATRQADSPYYDINVSGRVPFLQLDDGTGLEESALICNYLDALDGNPSLHPPSTSPASQALRFEATARSLMDGLSVWGREYLYRPPELRSDFIIDHEQARADRLIDYFESVIDRPELSGPLNMAQITLACMLHGRDGSPPGLEWRSSRPKLSAWVERIGERQSISGTAPVFDAKHAS